MAAWLIYFCPVLVLKLKMTGSPITDLGTGNALLFTFNISLSKVFKAELCLKYRCFLPGEDVLFANKDSGLKMSLQCCQLGRTDMEGGLSYGTGAGIQSIFSFTRRGCMD